MRRLLAVWPRRCRASPFWFESMPIGARPARRPNRPSTRLRHTYAGKINFVQFDVTNAKAAAVSQEQAKALGLEKFYAATKTATSTVAVIDPKNGRVYSTFYNDNTVGDYESVIDAALKAEKSSA